MNPGTIGTGLVPENLPACALRRENAFFRNRCYLGRFSKRGKYIENYDKCNSTGL